MRPGRRPPRAIRSVSARVGGFAGQPQQRDLPGVFDLAQRLHGLCGADQLGAAGLRRRGSQRVVGVHRDHVALEAHPLRSGGRGPPGEVAPTGPLDGHFEIGRLLGGLGAVATVGSQNGVVVREHQQCRIGPGEAGQIANVDQVRDQHRIQFGRPKPSSECGSPLGMCHAV